MIPDAHVAASLGTPYFEGWGGAQVLVPRAAGQAARAYLEHRLGSDWRSSDGLPIVWEQLA